MFYLLLAIVCSGSIALIFKFYFLISRNHKKIIV